MDATYPTTAIAAQGPWRQRKAVMDSDSQEQGVTPNGGTVRDDAYSMTDADAGRNWHLPQPIKSVKSTAVSSQPSPHSVGKKASDKK